MQEVLIVSALELQAQGMHFSTDLESLVSLCKGVTLSGANVREH